MKHSLSPLVLCQQSASRPQFGGVSALTFNAATLAIMGLWMAMCLPSAVASPFPLAQQPAGTGGREPAPNVIVSIDDSGSMGSTANGKAVSSTNPTKMNALKQALIAQFGNPTATPPTKGQLEDDRIRLAWQAMWLNGYQTITPGAANSMRTFSGTQRTAFYNFVNALQPAGNTPSHRLMKQALDYMKLAPGINSPWADAPGTAQSTPYMACRRTYNIFLTDGGWNANNNESVGNADGVTTTLGDGTTVYDITSDQTRPYRDTWGGPALNQLSTLADLTFAAWAHDLQPTMSNSIMPIIRRSGSEVVGGTTLNEFWNPKNNPASWQHIVTHTIGFGDGAYKWTNNADTALIRPYWDSVTDNNYGGDYVNIVGGTFNWPDPINSMNENGRPFELWHMALNSRGKFYPARDATALSKAFADILNNVINDTSRPLASVSANSSRITGDTLFYKAGYNSQDWSGYLTGSKVTATGPNATPEWDAATLLNAAVPNNRVILTHDGSAGIPFRWASLPAGAPVSPATTTQRIMLNGTDGRGSDRVDYFRGVRTTEGTDPATFRIRSSVLGDIVNSNIWFLRTPSSGYKLPGYLTFAGDPVVGKRASMLYVGSNDGMLHGFEAKTGLERLAYVPLGVYPKLNALTSQSYAHQYYVDSNPFTGDVKFDVVGAPPVWKTYLAGFLGAGGKGFFVLDVTKPGDDTNQNSSFTEANASSLVVLDKTVVSSLPNGDDIGYIFAQPSMDPTNRTRAVQFAIMNNNRPALIMGNGVNSVNERPVLLIQFLDGSKEIQTLVASVATGLGNGLNNPQVIDLNNDGKADLVYAGDMNGNMWKFDISSADSTQWKTSFNNKPLFTATDSTGNTQPIMTAPVWKPHPLGGIVLGFGTGRNLTANDRTDISEQTIYAIWDLSKITIASSGTSVLIADNEAQRIADGRARLVKQTGNATVVAVNGTSKFYNFTASTVDYGTSASNPNKRGWYMNFIDTGERASNNPFWEDFGDYVSFFSAVPAAGTDSNTETCSLSSRPEIAYRSTFDLISGAGPKTPLYITDPGSNLAGNQTLAFRVNTGESVSFRGGGTTGTNEPKTICTGVKCDKALTPTNAAVTTGWRER